ncbi:hypothetical protein [Costertonia aggregata]|uniref:Uncharacterized protein n=1 Tax=Costertonia aggregata TaxID=343403 RepID=A0A7H9AS37_9FLAO|nr:hypothetical protein [Costertonia aggregata]QLG46260.1 hypothetical protein HYG79_13200 [Costertonia aggregata]
MKTIFCTLCVLAFFSLTSFSLSEACEYAGSNIGFITSQTEKAIDAKDHQISRYHTFKALNAIEKSRKQFEACGCDYALDNINESLDNLKKATRTSTLSGSRILLKRALEYALGSLEAIEKHDLHDSKYGSDVLVMNTTGLEIKEKNRIKPSSQAFYKKIDESLIDFDNSLNHLIMSLDCNEAKAYCTKVYENCEQKLLLPDLSEGKKYYNLKTKEIVARAIKKLEEKCD